MENYVTLLNLSYDVSNIEIIHHAFLVIFRRNVTTECNANQTGWGKKYLQFHKIFIILLEVIIVK